MKKLLFVIAAVSALFLISCSDDSSSSSTPVSSSIELPASVGTNELKGLTLSDGSETIIKFDDEKITETFTDKDDGSVSIGIYKYTYNSEKKEIYVSYYGFIRDGKEYSFAEGLKSDGLSSQAIEDMMVQTDCYSILSYTKFDNAVTFHSVYDGSLNCIGPSFSYTYSYFSYNSNSNYLEDICFYDNKIQFVDGDYYAYLHFSENTFTGNIYPYNSYESVGNLSGSYELGYGSSSPRLTFTFDSIICDVEEIKFFNGKSVNLDLELSAEALSIVNK